MKLHSIIGNVCLIASVALLVLVYGPSPYWPVLIAVPAALLLSILARKTPAFWRASILLCVFLGLDAAGVLLRRPLFPLVLVSIAALIWWDLTDLEEGQQSAISAKAHISRQKYRLQSLALTTGASLLLGAIGIWLQAHLPFGVIALLILLVTGCCVYAVGILRNPPLSRE